MVAVLEEILKGLAKRIHDAGFVSKAGGLMQEVSVSSAGAASFRVVSQVAPFADGKLLDMSPDSSDTAITYFTAGASRVVRQDMYTVQLENEVVLNAWINGKRIGKNPNADPMLQMLQIIRKAKFQIEDGSPLRMVEIDLSNPDAQVNVSRYGWDDPKFQYGASPHQFFAIGFRINYILATGCQTQSVQVLNPAC